MYFIIIGNLIKLKHKKRVNINYSKVLVKLKVHSNIELIYIVILNRLIQIENLL